jgi:hypothetical protein
MVIVRAEIIKDKKGIAMKISLLDRSLYYKGLMLLIRKDRKVHDDEKKMMMHIGKTLGFAPKFCANTIEKIMDNNQIVDSPPLFSETDIALCFIRDGLRLSAVDGQIDKAETTWLESVAIHNGIHSLWYEEVEKVGQMNHTKIIEDHLQLRHFTWE